MIIRLSQNIFFIYILISLGVTNSIFSQIPNAQKAGANAYFRGNYIEAGLSDRGTFGAPNGTRPSGYHNSRMSLLGFIANPAKDGWINYDGDYFIPGSPEEGFALEINTIAYNNNTRDALKQIGGAITYVNSNISYCGENAAEVIWEGAIGGINIHRSYLLTENGLFIKMTTTLTNITSTDLTNIYWMHNVDPDNNQTLSGNYTTTNTIEAQSSSFLDKLAVVKAEQGAVGGATDPDGSVVSIMASDDRARVTYGGFSNRDPSAIWNGTDSGLVNTEGASLSADEAISIAFNIGTLKAGKSTEFTYFYILSTDYASVLNCSDEDGDGNPDLNDQDDDDDGILDIEESHGNQPDGDEDGDGIVNWQDNFDNGFTGDGSVTDYTDANNDGIPDVYDNDQDLIPNHLDLDSDNDGCYDSLEGSNSLNQSDIDENGRLTGGGNLLTGIPLVVGSGQNDISSQNSMITGNQCDDDNDTIPNISDLCNGYDDRIDSDSDSIPDSCDLDSDNDGILDDEECSSSSSNFTVASSTSGSFILANSGGTANWIISNSGQNTITSNGLSDKNELYFVYEGTTPWDLTTTFQINDLPSGSEIRLKLYGFVDKISSDFEASFGSRFSTYTVSWVGGNGNAKIYDPEGTQISGGEQFISNGGSFTQNIGDRSSGAWSNNLLEWYIVFPVGATEFTISAIGGAAKEGFRFTADEVYCPDSDIDGTPDYLDLDSDNDGCYDAIEADEEVKESDLDSNGRIAIAIDGHTDGVPNLVSSGGVADLGGDEGQGITEGVKEASTLEIDLEPSDITICLGENVTFTGAASSLSTTTFTGTAPTTIPDYSGSTPNTADLVYQWQEQLNTSSSWTNIPNGGIYSNATTASLTLTNPLVGASNNKYRLLVTSTKNGCASVTTSEATLIINDVTGGTVGSNQTICLGDDPVAFTETVASTGSGTLSYQWESSTDGSIFTPIGGATNATYDAGVLTQTMWYRREVSSLLNGVTCTALSNIVQITADSVPTISIDDNTVAEGTTANFTATISQAIACDVTFDVTTSDGTAMGGSDYTSQTSQSYTITAGNTTVTIPVVTTNDSTYEPTNETYTVTLSNVQTGTGTLITTTDLVGSGTITDLGDNAPTISIDDIAVAEGSTANFTATLSHPSQYDVTFDVSTSDGSATAGDDYTAQSSVRYTIPAGSTTVIIPVATTDDSTYEPTNETYTVTMSNVSIGSTPAEAITTTDLVGSGTITDLGDSAPTISIDDITVAEGSTANFTATLSNAAQYDVTFDVSTSDGSATAGDDYSSQSSVLYTILAGSTTVTIPVVTINDTTYEPTNETYTVTMSNVSIGSTPAEAITTTDLVGSGTITDLGDSAPTISIDDITVAEGSTANFTATLSHPSQYDVTFDVSTSDGSATAVDDYTSQSSVLYTILAGSTTVTIPVVTINDTTYEPTDETYTVTMSNVSIGSTPAEAITTTDLVGSGTITDLGDSAPTISIDDITVAEGSTANFTATLSHPSQYDVTFDVSTSDGSATAGDDYTSQSSVRYTIPVGSTTVIIPVATTDDSTYEPTNETYTVTMSNVSIGSTLAEAITTTDLVGSGTITDLGDSAPTISIDDITVAEGSTANFTATLSHPSQYDVTFDVSTSDGSATAGDDYTAQSSVRYTIPAGSTTVTIPVVTINDTTYEPTNETYTVTMSNVSIGSTPAEAITTTDLVGSGTITDLGDNAPTISIDDITVAEGSTANFTATLSHPSQYDVTFDVSTSDGSATAGDDYTAQSSVRYTIPAGSTTVIIPVATTDDSTYEPTNETYTVTMSNVSIGSTLAEAITTTDLVGSGTITDLGDSAPTISIDDITVAEGSTANFTATLSHPSQYDVTFDVSTSDGSATAGDDYTAQSSVRYTIPAGSTTVTIPVVTINDTTYEPTNETYTVTMSNVSIGSTPAEAITTTDLVGSGTITDLGDSAPTISIDDITVAEGSTANFTATLSHPSQYDVTFDVSTSDGSATAGDDYTSQTSQIYTITAGSTTVTIPVVTINDTTYEPTDETYTVTMSNVSIGSTPAEAITTTDLVGSGTITDLGDSAPTISIDDITVAEGSIANFTATLSHPSQYDVTFDVSTSDGSATAGDDYTSQSSVRYTIPAGSTTVMIPVVTINDTTYEPTNETYTVTMSNVSIGSTPAEAITTTDLVGSGTITDLGDSAPTISIDDITVAEGSTANFTATLSHPSQYDVTFDVSTSDGSATAGDDYTAQSSILYTIPAGSTTVTIPVVTTDDSTYEPTNETYTVTMSNVSIGSTPVEAITTTDLVGSGTITDLGDSAPTISIDDITVAEGSTVNFTATLSHPSQYDVTFDVSTSDGSATAGDDYTSQSSQSYTILAGSTTVTIPVVTINDTTYEPTNETYTVTMSNVSIGSTPAEAITTTDLVGSGTITDLGDSAPTISIDDITVAEGSTANFTATLSHPSQYDVTFDVSTSDGSATAGDDYTSQTSQIYTITAGSTTVTIPVVTINDTTYEPTNESYTVTMSNVSIGSTPAEAITTTDLVGSGTITDLGDSAPTISIDDITVAEGSTANFTATLSNAAQYDVTFDVSTSDGSATAGDDYTAQSSQSYTIPAGSTTVTIPVVTINDTTYEPTNETYTVTMSNVSIGSTSAEAITTTDLVGAGTITDLGDSAPTISIDDITVAEGSTANFTATLSHPSQYDVTFDVSTSDGSATAGDDYTAQSSVRYTIPAGSTTVAIPVVTINDTTYEPTNETYTVTMSNVSIGSTPAEVITTTDLVGSGTITDLGDSAPTISIDDITVAEGSTANFTATLSHPSQYDVTFDVSTSDGSATAGDDYTSQSSVRYTIPAGSTTVMIPVVTINDTTYEPTNETYTVTMSNVSIGSTPAEAITTTDLVGSGTITDLGDSAPTISIDDITVAEGSTANFTATLSNPSQYDVTFDVSTSDGSATAGDDYTSQTSQIYTITAGSTTVTIPVVTINDTTYEPTNETYTVTMSNVSIGSTPAEAITTTDLVGSGTITDLGDSAPTISIDDITVAEGSTANFTATLSHPSQYDVTFDVSTSDGSATASDDYTSQTSQIYTITAGSTTVTIPVVTINDTTYEPTNETYTVTMSNVSIGSTPAEAITTTDLVGSGTITDLGDSAPTISIDDITVAEGSTANFTATLSNAAQYDVTFDVSTSDGSATAGDDYTSQSSVRYTILAGSTTVTIPVVTINDTTYEPTNETYTVTMSNVSIGSTPAEAITTTDLVGSGTITDLGDSAPTISIDDITVAEGSTANFTATLSNAAQYDVTFDVSTSDGSATAGDDYTAQSSILYTILAGSTTVTIPVVTINDTTYEPTNETYTVTMSNVSIGSTPAEAITTTDLVGSGTITDLGDSAPTISIDDITVAEGSTANFTATLSNAAQYDVTFDVSTSDGSATAGDDYTAQSSVLYTIPAGSTTVTIPVVTINDTTYEPTNETYTVTMSNVSIGSTPAEAITTTDLVGSGTITDLGDSAPTISIDDITVAEGSTANFTATLSNAAQYDVTFDVSTSDGSATAGDDYSSQSSVLYTILAGSTTVTIPVVTINDTTYEPTDETYTVTMSNVSIGSTPAEAITTTDLVGSGTITDLGDSAPTISIDDITVAEGSTANFTATLSHPSQYDVTFDVSTSDGSATAVDDYTSQSSVLYTILAGSTTVTIPVVTINDTTYEPTDETYTVTMSNVSIGSTPAEAITTTDLVGSGTITDLGDSAPTISIDDITVAEGSTANFTATLSNAAQYDVTFDVSTSDGSATAGDDYTAQSSVLYTILAGSTTVTIPVVTIDDTTYEPTNEIYTVTMSNVSIGSTPAEAITTTDLVGSGTITDLGDSAPTISIDDITVAEGSTANFTATLSHPSQYDVTFDVSTSDGSATAGDDYTAQSSVRYTIPAGSTVVTIPVVTINDTTYEPTNETYTVTMSNVSIGSTPAEAITTTDLVGSGTITDLGDSAPTISIDDITVAEGSTANFTATLSNPSQYDVTFDVSTSDGSATAGDDYTSQSSVLYTIPAGSTTVTIPVVTINDTTYEPTNETYTVTMSNVSIGSTPAEAITTTDLVGSGTITDLGDSAPTISIDDIAVAEGSTANFTATLSHPSQYDVTFDVSTSDGSATASDDYTSQTSQIYTITAGSTTVTIPVVTINDTTYEPTNETYTVTMSNVSIGSTPAEAITTTDLVGSGTITDLGDSAPTISIDDITVAEGSIANFTATLSHPSQYDVTFDVSTSDGSATAGDDYTAQSSVLYTILAGSTTVTIPVVTIDDTTYEPTNEIYTVTMSNVSIGSTPAEAITTTDLVGSGTITDLGDSAPTISIDDITVAEGSTANFTATLSHPSQYDVTFDVSTSDGSATAGDDYTAQSSVRYTIPAGSTVVTIPVVTINDTTYEPTNETYTVTMSNVSIGSTPAEAITTTDLVGSGTITDLGDSAPTISIDDITVAEGSTANFTATLSHPSQYDVTFDVSTSDGSATAGDDYTSQSSVLYTILAGSTTVTIPVVTINDTTYEPTNETYTVTMSNVSIGSTPAEAITTTDLVGSGTITDLGDSAPTISIDDIAVAEGSTANFTATLSHPSQYDVTFDVSTSDGFATAGDDYTSQSSVRYTILAGSTTVTIPVVTINDTTYEPTNETYTVTMSNVSIGSTPAEAITTTDLVGSGTITDLGDSAPTISIDDITVAEGSTANFTATLSNAAQYDVTFDVSTSDGSATAGDDYTSQSSVLYTILAGSTTVTIPVVTTDDTTYEPTNETYTVTMSNVSIGSTPAEAITTTDLVGAGTITDLGDSAPTISIDDITVAEGSTANFTATLSNPSQYDVTFDVSTSDGSATASDDYTSQSSVRYTILAGSTTVMIPVVTINDTTYEPTNETYTVTMSNVSIGSTPAEAITTTDLVGSGTITDLGDNAPTISIDDITVAEGSIANFTATLSNASQYDVTFDVSTNDLTATFGTDYLQQINVSYTIPEGSTTVIIPITTIDNNVYETTETYEVLLSNVFIGSPSPEAITMTDLVGGGTITDNDVNNPCLPDSTDTDGDGYCDAIDPGPNDPCIPDNTDADNDGVCDTVDPDPSDPCIPDNTDADNDGVCDTVDPNPSDPCIPDATDADGDGYCDTVDPNPSDPCIPDSTDADNDGVCDTIDPNPTDPCVPDNTDADNDGVCDTVDPNPSDSCVPKSTDTDGDGYCDIVDPGPNDPCIPDATDSDGDGYCDTVDPGPNDPCIPDAIDADGDGVCDTVDPEVVTPCSSLDLDSDGDGICDSVDPNPTNPCVPNGADSDGDGVCDIIDPNPSDPCNPNSLDEDGDGYCDTVDPNPTDPCIPDATDADGDGVCDTIDPNPNDPCNPNSMDEDGDGYCDTIDPNPTDPCIPDATDADGDGVCDTIDPNPNDPCDSDSADSDGDGYCDTVDPNPTDPCIPDARDADGDGICDTIDPNPNESCDPNSVDADNDGVCDTVDPDPSDPCIPNATDADGDGVCDTVDPNPNDPCIPNGSDIDGDGICDVVDPIVTDPCPVGAPDSDGDGVCDTVDPDPSDPCIPDATDADGDGVCDTVDPDPNDPCIPDNTDADADGVCDTVDPDPGNPCIPNSHDEDMDGVCDTIDPDITEPCVPDSADSDGDGICDVIDPNPSDPCIPNSNDEDMDGVCDTVDPDPTDPCVPNNTDADNDGVCDVIDPDPGNPCIPNSHDEDMDGVCDTVDPDITDPCIPDNTDADGDGVCDVIDPDPSNPCIPDNTDSDGDGTCDILDVMPNDSCMPDPFAIGTADCDGDGISNADEYDSNGDGSGPDDQDGDGILDVLDIDDDGDGILTSVEVGDDRTNPDDTDGDGVPDYQDLDSDNDGISDLVEGGGDSNLDANNDGVIDDQTDSDNDGLPDLVDSDNGGTVSSTPDTDGDGVPDYQDLDSDGDGINDVIEAGGADTNNDGQIDTDNLVDGTNLPDEDNDGTPDTQEPNNDALSGSLDVDGDGVIDDQTDSDGDGIADVVDGLDGFGDALTTDTDGDGIEDLYDLDDDNDGILDVVEQLGDENRDTDNDGIPDHLDLDSDGDGVLDLVESGQNASIVDVDGDGVLDSLLDADNDGIIDTADADDSDINAGSKTILDDTDGDGRPDFQDLDSDNDGISDLVESGTDISLDIDGDGVIDDQSDTDGDGLADVVDPNRGGMRPRIPDTDTDGIPDYQDIDSDDDGVTDLQEGGSDPLLDLDGDGILDTFLDSDGDGMLDSVDPDTNGDVPDTPDFDGDGLPDYQDIDDDDDGILTILEDVDGDGNLSNDDSDGDGLPDYLDIDDDGDGIATIDESADQNGDGGPEDALDTDEDGTPDYLDPDTLPCLTVYNEFTPNGDGANDTFVISCIGEERYKHNRLEIYNRWGVLVYSKNRYDNSWSGESTGRFSIQVKKQLPSGTYYYVLDLGTGASPRIGWLYINRE
ncbi:Calx-beta domain-containing protein [Tenacibaculum sp. C7A-26P2]|uniref:Calx-beta domain-containing protein n=1 Tax=Tenacibaculum sp. C7A-26P2 TaxID=3447504 RepID=UPI003F876F39